MTPAAGTTQERKDDMAEKKLPMSDYEIAQEYRQAAKPREQIAILADLNACDKKVIVEKLLAAGCEVPKYYTKEKRGTPSPQGEGTPGTGATSSVADATPSPQGEGTEGKNAAATYFPQGEGMEKTAVNGKELLAILNSLWDMEALTDMRVCVNGRPAERAALTGMWEAESGRMRWHLDLHVTDET